MLFRSMFIILLSEKKYHKTFRLPKSLGSEWACCHSSSRTDSVDWKRFDQKHVFGISAGIQSGVSASEDSVQEMNCKIGVLQGLEAPRRSSRLSRDLNGGSDDVVSDVSGVEAYGIRMERRRTRNERK